MSDLITVKRPGCTITAKRDVSEYATIEQQVHAMCDAIVHIREGAGYERLSFSTRADGTLWGTYRKYCGRGVTVTPTLPFTVNVALDLGRVAP